MKTHFLRRSVQSVVLVLTTLLLLGSPAAAGGNGQPQPRLHSRCKKMVRLQLRIAEAKGRKNSSRYYRSIARQQKIRKSGASSSYRPGGLKSNSR